jgi:hypothetical protein
LEYIIFHSSLKDHKDIGRPLTFYPHLSNFESPLEKSRIQQYNYQGFINLIGLALVLSHVRLMYENYLKYGILLSPSNLLKFGIEKGNSIFLTGTLMQMGSAIYLTYLIELFASRSKSTSKLSIILHLTNLLALLIVPLFYHRYVSISPSNISINV